MAERPSREYRAEKRLARIEDAKQLCSNLIDAGFTGTGKIVITLDYHESGIRSMKAVKNIDLI